MIVPKLLPSSRPAGRGERVCTTAFVDNVAGDVGSLNRALPLVLGANANWTSDAILCVGFRSLQVDLSVTAGTLELHFLALHPYTLAIISDDHFADYTNAEGHLGVGVGALAGNGGSGGGPLFTGGLDGRQWAAFKLKLLAKAAGATVSALGGVWLSST